MNSIRLASSRDVLPEVKLGQLIPADDPVKAVVGVKGPEMPHRVDRVADPALDQFVVGDLEAVVPFHRPPQHLQPFLGRRGDVVGLEGGPGRRDQDQAVEMVLLISILGGHEMAKMDGVEAPAEKTDFHERDNTAPRKAAGAQGQLPTANAESQHWVRS